MGDTTTPRIAAEPYAGHAYVLPAKRLANAIGTAKILFIAMAVLGAVLNLGSDAAPVLVLWAFVAVVSIYVTFGWLEETLRLLVGIAHNTAGTAALDAAGDRSGDVVD
ncbi:hypothetical protein [Nocardioides sp. zg-1228]|uniref:hypothetical protein n=1 Tax=Nocardioides sp. zg-1228 TaxID=2763008 RepID=UPI00164321AB|nr:hypothetical protein [Nocardioides sp. zg-1228]MBC2934355.1 hypothetical protein [Nocardioides sp. zg-1228]QSF59131.1 hypothetical protein JX575_08180 [Nocardioides sp. zg-1228]